MGTGVDNARSTLSKFLPGFQKPPAEVAVPTIEWKPVTVLTPTLQIYKMGESPARSGAGAAWCKPADLQTVAPGRVPDTYSI